MNALRIVLRVLLPLCALALGVGGAILLKQAGEQPPVEPAPRAQPLVETTTARATSWRPVIRTQGSVTPAQESELVAEVQGRVLELGDGLAIGARFTADELLVRIDARDYELAVLEAEAAIAQAELALQLETAEAESSRRAWLSMGQEGEPSPLVLREPQLAETRARLAAQKGRLESARRDLSRTTIRAPYDGFTFDKAVDLGQYVARGARLAHLIGSAAVEVRLPLHQSDLALLDLAAMVAASDEGAVILRAELGGELRTWRGRVVRRDDWLDPRSRMLSIVVRVEAPFAPGANAAPMFVNLFVEAELPGREIPGVFVLPRVAVRSGARVFVVDAEQKLRSRAVTVLRTEGDDVIVQKGLAEGELVCITPLDVETDGMPVRIAKPRAEGSR